ncbi:hypothetical protein FRX31_011231 [Thalictrum thalictroides]|uniref:RNase H type-1 domain-containing protein n=1 Tax=Thalictrum thalictroides TaxID=46969 RepID=A0A7J6WP79_THATH|nr:hypothetical protein FRX31_011231 [Thalictrum thalictroides]
MVANVLNKQFVHTSSGNSIGDDSVASGPTSVLGTIWILPGLTFLKINVDIKFTSREHRFGIGYICRNANGEFIAAGCFSGSAGRSKQAECAGILAATRWALLNIVRKVVMETGCRFAAEFLKGNAANIDWSSTSTLLKFQICSRALIVLIFSFVTVQEMLLHIN